MESFFIWQTLMTYSGATLATTLVTQFLKEIPFVSRVPARVLSYFTALVMILAATFVMTGLTWRDAVMAFINAAAVALAANGAFDAIRE